MTISITLAPDQDRPLEELARQHGKDPSVYVNDVLTRDSGDGPASTKPGAKLGDAYRLVIVLNEVFPEN